jgi:G3E family GTPase
MRQSGIRHLLIETSGGADPRIVIEEILSAGVGELHTVATFVDARMLLHDYDGGRHLLDLLERPAEISSAEALLIEQLQVASVIVITKLDIVQEELLSPVLRALQTINPTATLVGGAHGHVHRSVLLDTPAYQSPQIDITTKSITGRKNEIGSRVIRDPRPLHPQRFFDLYRDRLGIGLFRSKGFIWFASRPGHVLLWNQAGGAMGLEFLATWRTHVLEHDKRLLSEEKDLLKRQLDELHPLFGDRSCELTLIGHARDLENFGADLMGCFCTDAELAHWQDGGDFSDPWPANLKILH